MLTQMKTAILGGALALAATTAQAHATLEQTAAQPGQTTKITLRVPHGCAGEATHTVEMTLPDGYYAAKPMPKPGWTLTTETGRYASAYDNHGTQMTEGLRRVTWSGGSLADDWYDEFSVRGVIGPELAPGTTLYFPAVQTCANGAVAWTDTSGTPGAEGPAPRLILASSDGGAQAHGMDHGASHGTAPTQAQAQAQAEVGVIQAGALRIEGAFSRATLPNAPVGGGFMSITNTGTADDRLISASSPAAARVEVHEMAMQGDVMKMRELADGVVIGAGETVMLQPGGFHLMLMKLRHPLVQGETVPVTLTFEQAGTVEVPLAIGAPNAKGQGHMMKH